MMWIKIKKKKKDFGKGDFKEGMWIRPLKGVIGISDESLLAGICFQAKGTSTQNRPLLSVFWELPRAVVTGQRKPWDEKF